MGSQEELFRSIYMRYLPLVRIIAKRYRIPSDDIDDVVQNVFFAFYKTYGLEKPDEDNRRLLARITNNCCLDYMRKQKTHPEFCYDPVVIQEEMFTDSFFASDNLTILLKKQEYERVMEALASLKKGSGDVIRLYVIEGRPMDEVARILGVSEKACRMRLSRAREELRRKCNKQPKNGTTSRRSFPENMNLQEA